MDGDVLGSSNPFCKQQLFAPGDIAGLISVKGKEMKAPKIPIKYVLSKPKKTDNLTLKLN